MSFTFGCRQDFRDENSPKMCRPKMCSCCEMVTPNPNYNLENKGKENQYDYHRCLNCVKNGFFRKKQFLDAIDRLEAKAEAEIKEYTEKVNKKYFWNNHFLGAKDAKEKEAEAKAKAAEAEAAEAKAVEAEKTKKIIAALKEELRAEAEEAKAKAAEAEGTIAALKEELRAEAEKAKAKAAEAEGTISALQEKYLAAKAENEKAIVNTKESSQRQKQKQL
jgi:hypothetical protein